LLAPRPTPKLEDHPSSAVRDSLFNLFAATLLIRGRSSIRNLRTRHAMVTETHYMGVYPLCQLSCLHRRPFRIAFIQFLSGLKVYIGRTLKMTERNHPVANLEYMHLDIHDVVLGHKFKLTFIFVTRVFWKSNRGSVLNIVFFPAVWTEFVF
jgi:hypothetical protein